MNFGVLVLFIGIIYSLTFSFKTGLLYFCASRQRCQESSNSVIFPTKIVSLLRGFFQEKALEPYIAILYYFKHGNGFL